MPARSSIQSGCSARAGPVYSSFSGRTPRTLAIAALGLARLALAVGAATALAFGALSLALPAIPAAAVGVLLYAAVGFAMRSLGLSDAWAYVRGLH